QLRAQARSWAERLGKPVRLWMSDKQDAFVRGIAAEFPGVPHRSCTNHCRRDVAKPILEADSHAKVKMRRTIRGLRAIERAGWAGSIDRGLSTVQAAQADVRHQVAEVEAIQATFAPASGSCARRQAQFQAWQAQFQGSADPLRHHMGDVMASFAPGLFVGGED